MGAQPILCNDPLLTQQNAKDECDINLIVERAKRGADLSQLTRQPMFGDFIGMPSFREALLLVNDANDRFMALDAEVRKRFGNDPAQLLDFVADPSNRDEAVRLGLLKAPEPKQEDPHLDTLRSIDESLKTKSKKSGDLKGQPE